VCEGRRESEGGREIEEEQKRKSFYLTDILHTRIQSPCTGYFVPSDLYRLYFTFSYTNPLWILKLSNLTIVLSFNQPGKPTIVDKIRLRWFTDISKALAVPRMLIFQPRGASLNDDMRRISGTNTAVETRLREYSHSISNLILSCWLGYELRKKMHSAGLNIFVKKSPMSFFTDACRIFEVVESTTTT
jgi:hypothetical protein